MRLRIALALALFPVVLPAQVQSPGPAATTYMDRYRQVIALAPNPERVADVAGLVLHRDIGDLTLERGKLYLLNTVAGRTVGAVFKGVGRFSFAPSLAVEQAQLQRATGKPALDDPITQATLLFADSTAQQLLGLTFSPGDVPGDIRSDLNDLLDWFKGDHEGAFNASVIAPLLNGENSGFFLAHVRRADGDPLIFELDPNVSEAIAIYRPVRKMRWGTNWALATRFPPRQSLPGSAGVWAFRNRLTIPNYRLDLRLTPTGSADLDFAAHATFMVKPREAIGPWLRFGLHPKLVIDSARWNDGTDAAVFKAKDDDDLWVSAGHRLAPGDSLALTLFYHGNLIDRYGNWFYIDPEADWWPTNRQGQDNATFEITYHSPNWYPLASVGERMDSSTEGRVMTTRWITKNPSPFATFNLGLFQTYHVEHPGEPTLDVMLSEDAHRLLRQQGAAAGVLLLEHSHMRENVAADVSNSLKWFTHLFGEPTFQRYFVTEIPYFEGVSFPGVIHLSWLTFWDTSLDGFDEFFRAHEVAHQWWGNGVRPASYRDAWLSEGLASFSGLWYLQSLRKSNDAYFKFFDRYAAEIRDVQNTAGAIWVGYRNATPDSPSGYQVMIYEKGAWVFHMLRTLMLDLQTRKEDRFMAMMQDFYSTFKGSSASTDDFAGIVEQHVGIPMGWFFDQWVRGTALPTYHVAWRNEPAEGGKQRVHLRVTQEGVPPDFQAFVLVSADLGENRFANFRIRVNGTQTDYFGPLVSEPAKGVTFNELHSVLADVKTERW